MAQASHRALTLVAAGLFSVVGLCACKSLKTVESPAPAPKRCATDYRAMYEPMKYPHGRVDHLVELVGSSVGAPTFCACVRGFIAAADQAGPDARVVGLGWLGNCPDQQSLNIILDILEDASELGEVQRGLGTAGRWINEPGGPDLLLGAFEEFRRVLLTGRAMTLVSSDERARDGALGLLAFLGQERDGRDPENPHAYTQSVQDVARRICEAARANPTVKRVPVSGVVPLCIPKWLGEE